VKGALVEFTTAFGASVPNVIGFQFNPEVLRRTWTQPLESTAGGNPLAVKGAPGESYSLTLMLDSTDDLEGDPASPATLDALASGLSSRIAALEMLMFPVPAMSATAPGGKGSRATPAAEIPAVLFVWGQGHMLPVRIATMSVTERLFDARLNPTQATVDLAFRVMTPKELKHVSGPFRRLAPAAYEFTQHRREAMALANLSRSAGAVELPRIPGL
jgi:hypothetical protein